VGGWQAGRVKYLDTGMGIFKQAEIQSAGRQLMERDEGGTTVPEVRD